MTLQPMLASPSTGASNRVPIDIKTLEGTHAFDTKLDGIRAFAIWESSRLTLVNRNGVDISAKYPELVGSFGAFGPPSSSGILDGEIMANDGRFESVLTRDKQANAASIKAAAARMPVSFHAFDLPTQDATQWTDRRAALDRLILPPRFHRTLLSYDAAFLQQTRDAGLEGVIAKRLTGRYESGRRSRSWIKFKNLHRVTCLIAGYEPGTGARSHFGAMLLALVTPEGDVVSAGRVGTGMDNAEITDLKARLDRRDVLVVEIECLGVTSGSTLRMPVYKGIRSDVDVLAASTTQLATLPRS